MTVRDRMLAFVDRMAVVGIASASQLRGCSPEEVVALERKYGVRLPESYALFLGLMGHGAGRLVSAGEFDLYYPDVLRLTEEERRSRAAVLAEEPTAAAVELPRHALIICGRYGEQFSFIECTRPNDSPVFYFNHWDEQIREAHDSVVGFLDSMLDDAVHWKCKETQD